MAKQRQYYVFLRPDGNFCIEHLTDKQALRYSKWWRRIDQPQPTWEEADELQKRTEKKALEDVLNAYLLASRVTSRPS